MENGSGGRAGVPRHEKEGHSQKRGHGIPPKLRAEFRSNLDDDFRVILAAAGGVLFERRDADKRYIQVEFESDEPLEKAREVAEKKHPVDRGSALHEYLERCIQKLMKGS